MAEAHALSDADEVMEIGLQVHVREHLEREVEQAG